MARALPNSLSRALRFPPDNDVGWCFGAIPPSKRSRHASTNLPRCWARNSSKPQGFAGVDNDCHIRLARAHDFAPLSWRSPPSYPAPIFRTPYDDEQVGPITIRAGGVWEPPAQDLGNAGACSPPLDLI
jgi:hypothetical protein